MAAPQRGRPAHHSGVTPVAACDLACLALSRERLQYSALFACSRRLSSVKLIIKHMERHGVALPFSQADPTMAQTLPSSDKMDNRTGSSNLVPPDERFWQHYSPHGEFPLSSVSSLVIHLLFFGLLALTAWLGVVLFSHSSRSLPVEAVRLDLGGGGGNPHGRGDAPNTGAAPKEVGSQQSNNATENTQTEDVPPPDLKVETSQNESPDMPDRRR